MFCQTPWWFNWNGIAWGMWVYAFNSCVPF